MILGLYIGLKRAGGGASPGPVNTVAPTLTNAGTGEIGDTLTCTNGTWTTAGTISGYTYQWRRDGAVIAGETANTYTLVLADDDALIACRVTATDEFGSRTRSSNTVGPYSLAGSGFTYFRPGGVDTYRRPDGTSIYLRP
jgi:hypothetical protein